MGKAGSRRSRAKVADPALLQLGDWYEGTPPGLEVVGIDLVCRRGHPTQIVGQFRKLTCDNPPDDIVTMKRLPGSPYLPSQESEGHVRVRAICPVCGHDWQQTQAHMEAAIAVLWKPHARRVIAYDI